MVSAGIGVIISMTLDNMETEQKKLNILNKSLS